MKIIITFLLLVSALWGCGLNLYGGTRDNNEGGLARRKFTERPIPHFVQNHPIAARLISHRIRNRR